MINNRGKPCRTCGEGIYTEMSVMDDISGSQTCNKCGTWVQADEKEPIEREAENLRRMYMQECMERTRVALKNLNAVIRHIEHIDYNTGEIEYTISVKYPVEKLHFSIY